MSRKTSIFYLTSILILGSCCTTKHSGKARQTTVTPVFTPGPAAIVYQTKANYNNLVPVTLSADKSHIVSYPDPMDVRSLPVPTLLKKGYLLDNRGIGKNTAFLSLTYKEYARLKHVPTTDSLQKLIIDKNPITKMYNCGLRAHFKDPVKAINGLIESGELGQKCKVVP